MIAIINFCTANKEYYIHFIFPFLYHITYAPLPSRYFHGPFEKYSDVSQYVVFTNWILDK